MTTTTAPRYGLTYSGVLRHIFRGPLHSYCGQYLSTETKAVLMLCLRCERGYQRTHPAEHGHETT